jgi:hypothetical protein
VGRPERERGSFSQRSRNRAEVDFTPLSSLFLLIF